MRVLESLIAAQQIEPSLSRIPPSVEGRNQEKGKKESGGGERRRKKEKGRGRLIKILLML